MKTKTTKSIIAAGAFCVLASFTRAQCPQICDSSANTALGDGALSSLISGLGNTAIGSGALELNTTGSENTANGESALIFNWTGSNNTATGAFAPQSNNASNNTADGYAALLSDTTGNDNTATGSSALLSNTTGSRNVATGFSALYNNQIGVDNTASGFNALYANTADYNTATGYQALENNTTGSNNTAHGLDALNTNTTGSYNTASGAYALFGNVGGSSNTADGDLALYQNTSGFDNTAVGPEALYANTSGAFNIAVGFNVGFSLTTGTNNIDIGNLGVAAESGTIRIGSSGTQTATFIAGIRGVAVAGGQPVAVNANGQLGVRASSARFKENIKPMGNASEAVFSLQPVTFRYKKELDPQAIPQFGLIAEQVEKVDPELVARDQEGKPYSARYEAVNAMLLNEFLKEHRKVEEQTKARRTDESEIAELKSDLAEERKNFESRITQQEKQIGALSACLQKVSARLESSAPPAQVVANN